MTTDLLQVDYFYRATIAQNYIKDVLSQLELIREEFVTYKLFYTEFHRKKFHEVEDFIRKLLTAEKCIKENVDLVFNHFDYKFDDLTILLDNIKCLKERVSFCLEILFDHIYAMNYYINIRLPNYKEVPSSLSSRCQDVLLMQHLVKLGKMVAKSKLDFGSLYSDVKE